MARINIHLTFDTQTHHTTLDADGLPDDGIQRLVTVGKILTLGQVRVYDALEEKRLLVARLIGVPLAL